MLAFSALAGEFLMCAWKPFNGEMLWILSNRPAGEFHYTCSDERVDNNGILNALLMFQWFIWKVSLVLLCSSVTLRWSFLLFVVTTELLKLC
jgi:hypothetical protein